MVKSKINPDKVHYEESKDLDKEDIEYSSPLYDYLFNGLNIVIALGRQRHTFSRYDIVFFPIYLIIDEYPRAQIGVFEIENNKLIDVLDEDGDVKLSKKNILFYVTKEFVENLLKKYDTDEVEKDEVDISKDDDVVDLTGEDVQEEDENDVLSLKVPQEKKTETDKNVEEELKEGIFKTNESIKIPPMLPEETNKESQEIKREFKEAPKNLWIEKLMKNSNYDVIDNEGGGDCFFAVIRDAFKQIGKETTVAKLRALLAKEATDEIFQQSRSIYLAILTEMQQKEKEIKETTKTISLLKKRIEKSQNKKENQEMIEQAKMLLEDIKKLKIEKSGTSELLDEFEHMKPLTNLEQYREFILTRHFWADTWTISTMEKLLNIKMILLSQEAYSDGDVDSVMQCGQLNDSDLEDAGKFVPDYYIMTSYTGRHYKSISYKEKQTLKFREIPYDVKILIINKCLEKNAGPYYLIQDFRNLKTRLGLSVNEGEPEADEDEYLTRDLYDKDTVFSFYSKANKVPKPGKGSGESIKSEDTIKFKVLGSIKDWRRKLDDSWITPFSIEGKRWNSVEHYFLASQFKKGFPDFYLKFSVESGMDISKDLELARIAGSKSGRVKDRILRESKITMDPDFYTLGTNPIFEVERVKALKAKFSGNLELKNMLLETKDSKLVHFQRSKGHIADTLLMKVRKELQ